MWAGDVEPMQTSSPSPSLPIRMSRNPKKSCAPACIAAFAPRPVRPMCSIGNELDSPRGRIYLIKDMLEHDRPATPEVVTHIDRCLSCLACMTTCPSGVHYMHLVDHARDHIEHTYRRPLVDRLLRAAAGLADALSAALPAGVAGGAARQAVRAAVPTCSGSSGSPRCCGSRRGAAASPLEPQTFPAVGRAQGTRRAAGRLRQGPVWRRRSTRRRSRC